MCNRIPNEIGIVEVPVGVGRGFLGSLGSSFPFGLCRAQRISFEEMVRFSKGREITGAKGEEGGERDLQVQGAAQTRMGGEGILFQMLSVPIPSRKAASTNVYRTTCFSPHTASRPAQDFVSFYMVPGLQKVAVTGG